jgi:hypothetical protein
MIGKFRLFSQFSWITCAYSDIDIGNIEYRFAAKSEVDDNRQNFFQSLGIMNHQVVEMNQIHSSKVEVISDVNKKIIEKSDGLITDKPGIYLMVKTADCFPLVCLDPKKRLVGVIHVGWRGAVEKIFLQGLLKILGHFNSRPEDILIGIGPGLRKCCFEQNSFLQESLPEWENYIFKTNSLKNIDIPLFIIDSLIEVGIKRNNIEDCGICTYCNQNFFSHRRSVNNNLPEGRFASILGINENDRKN